MSITDPLGYAGTLAKRDGTFLREQIAGLTIVPGEREILCDGSQYSPSWRALSGGAEIWRMGDRMKPSDWCDVQEAYIDWLDRIEADLGLYWEEGILFLDGEGFEHEEDC